MRSEALTAAQTAAIRALLTAAFRRGAQERFTETDWAHALGGVHFLLEDRCGVLAHAAVIERPLRVGTHRRSFYERLGWSLWLGPSSVETPGGPRRTPEDDGGILFLRTPSSPPLDPSASLACDWRAGDVW
jgi:aminoglycoside 2'-N-acetyltransferase I